MKLLSITAPLAHSHLQCPGKMAECAETTGEIRTLLGRDKFIERLREVGTARYHDLHPFHVAMHDGLLTRTQLQTWVLNRYYYQTRIPIKDALIVGKSEDPHFRRVWLHRIVDHDGTEAGEGGLELWMRLGEALGVPRARMQSLNDVLPGVRFACDAYVNFVREASLVEAVASSLTEFFAPDLMSRRIAAFEEHYPFVAAEGLAYFRQRVPRARRDSNEAIDLVVDMAVTPELQMACVRALVRKTEILWHLLDSVTFECMRAYGLAFPARKTPTGALERAGLEASV